MAASMNPVEAPAPVPVTTGAPGRLCPSCLADNPASFLFCRSCGRLLPSSAEGTPDTVRTLPPPTSEQVRPTLVPISIDLVRAGRATLYDSDSIRRALTVVEATSRRLRELMENPAFGRTERFVWERNPELAESSSLIEGAGALLALAAAPETRDSLRPLFVRRAFWVLQVAADRTRALLAKGDR